MQDLSARQAALEKKAAAPSPPAPLPLPAHRQPFSLTGSLVPPPNPLGALSGLIGAPPKVRHPLQSPPPPLAEAPADEELGLDEETGEPLLPEGQGVFAKAMLQQSRALGSLVSHLVAQAEASDSSLSALGGVSLGSRGASKRERMQEQLAARSGSFLLQVSQQALRRLAPSEPIPTTRVELTARRPVFTLYAERFGGFGSQRGLGIMFWLLANILDALVAGDTVGAEEMAALAIIATEQASQDSGFWDIAYLLTLLEDPPHQLFAHRPSSQNPRLRAFGGLTPQPWATTTLAYIKEIDAIQSRRSEATSSAKAKAPAAAEPDPSLAKSRRPRFPKKPKEAAN